MLVDGEDMLGDGVNIAARLEGPASQAASASQGRRTITCEAGSRRDFVDLGGKELKNIARPVRVFR